jgi:hypothetical protein
VIGAIVHAAFGKRPGESDYDYGVRMLDSLRGKRPEESERQYETRKAEELQQSKRNIRVLDSILNRR